MANVLTQAVSELQTSFIAFFPDLVYAVILLIVGYILGGIAHTIVKRILDELKVDKKLGEKRLNYKVSAVVSFVVKWMVYLAFVQAAANRLSIFGLELMIANIIAFLPRMLGAALILIAANFFGLYAKEEVIGGKDLYTRLMGKLVYFIVLYIGFTTALPSIGISAALFERIFLLIVGSLALGLAIALGWGLKDSVNSMSKDYIRKYHKK